MRVRALSYYGNFLSVNNLGVFICGAPSIGKTNLSLELLERGHKLIADDLTFFIPSNHDVIGFSPRKALGKLYSNGCLIDLKRNDRNHSVIRSSKLGLICHLVASKSTLQSRLMAHKIVTQTLFGRSFPEFLCPKTTANKQARILEKMILKLKNKEGF